MKASPSSAPRSVQVRSHNGAVRDTREALVLVHGFASNSECWREVRPLLEQRFRVVAVDVRGLSTSCLNDELASLPELAAFVDEAAGTDRYSIVGHSFGATIALTSSFLFPDRVTALTLIAPAGFGPEISPALLFAAGPASALPFRMLYAPAVRTRLTRWAQRYQTAPNNGASVRAALATYEALATPQVRRRFRAGLRTMLADRNRAAGLQPGTVTVPAQVIWGSRDRVLPVWQCERAARAVGARRIHILPDAGHAPHRTHSTITAAHIVEFHS